MRKKVLLIGGNSFVGQSIVSGLGDNYQAQMRFHKTLADWLPSGVPIVQEFSD